MWCHTCSNERFIESLNINFFCLPQTPVENPPAAAVLLRVAAHWKHPADDRWGVTEAESQGNNSAGSHWGEDMLLVLFIPAVSRPDSLGISRVWSSVSVPLCSIFQVASEDLIPDKMREDYQDGESLASVCVQSFKERWWNKILLTGVLETDGRRHQTQTDTESWCSSEACLQSRPV